VSGDELKSSIMPNSTGVFHFDAEYHLNRELVNLKISFLRHIDLFV